MIRAFIFLLLPFMSIAQPDFELLKNYGGFKHPECIYVYNPSQVFISDIGKSLESSRRDSDGVIYQCPLENISAKTRFNKNFKLNAPKGLAVKDGKLYIADIDKIIIAGIDDGTKYDEIDFKDSTIFLNDLFLLDESTLLVSATNQHELYAISLPSKEIVNLSHNDMEGANGICSDNKMVYVCGFSSKIKGKGSIFEYNTETGKITTFIKEVGHLDGIKSYGNYLLVSDWGSDYNHGKIWLIDLESRQVKVIAEGEQLKSPSGFEIYNDMIIIPCLDNGHILIYKKTESKASPVR